MRAFMVRTICGHDALLAGSWVEKELARAQHRRQQRPLADLPAHCRDEGDWQGQGRAEQRRAGCSRPHRYGDDAQGDSAASGGSA